MHGRSWRGPTGWQVWTCLLAVVGAGTLAPAGALDVAGLPQARTPYRDLTHDGAWCWFADPRAVYHEGAHRRTYAGWVNRQGDVVVGRIDHDSGEVRCTILHRRLERDDHASPALVVRPDGRLMVFYCRHADDAMRLRISMEPEDISAWGPERRLELNDPDEHRDGQPGVYCYPNPSRLAGEGNRLVLLWRGTNWKPCLSISDDGGATWSTGRILLAEPDAGGANRPYLKASCDGRRSIHLAVTTGHPRNEPANSIFYGRYEGGSLHRADGTPIAGMSQLPVAPSRMDVVYDARRTGIRAWIWDVAADGAGRPVVVYARLPAENRHVYHYARWDGDRWVDHPIADAGSWFPRTPEGGREPEPHYSGGVVLDHEDPSVVYLSRPVNGVFEIERWSTADGGASWDARPVTADSSRDNIRPVVVRGHRDAGGPSVLWMKNVRDYVHYTDYRAAIVMDLSEPAGFSPSMDRQAVLNVMEAVARWQLENPAPHSSTDWTSGALYAGVMALAGITGDRRYEQAMIEMGRANGWKPGPRPFFADDHCVGQAYLELYLKHRDPVMLEPIKATYDALRDQPAEVSLEWKDSVHLRHWAWCDALFMSPPGLARLATATGDERYLDLLDRLWWRTTDFLYDPQERLYYRDSRYFDRREPNGSRVFWSRGNGWVIAGLARVLDHLPADRPSRPRYEALFREMAVRIAELQGDDGLWRASLLDPESFPEPETSGSGFFCFALAWGVNHGLLDRERFEPVIARAWAGLVGCVDANGRMGHVQAIGAEPRPVTPRDTDIFGVGAFLLAGRQVQDLASK